MLTADPELPVPPGHYGGIERIVDLLARNLVNRGHEVTLFCNPESTCPVQRVDWPGLKSGRHLDTVRNAAMLLRFLTTNQCDVVHSFSRLAYLAPILPLPIPKLMSYQRPISPHTTRLAHRLSFGSLHFSAISNQMMREVGRTGSWHLVPNGVPLEVYSFRKSVPPNAPLMFLGRLEEIKGPHLAIEVARRVGSRLVLAGNIPNEHCRWFDEYVAPFVDEVQVSYVGPVDDRQKNELLGRARALLMPILWDEPFGIVMAEAMACGTPVIGFARGAVPEVVESGVTGFVVDNIDEMVAAITKLDQIDRSACRSRVDQLYSDRAVTDGYMRAYRQLLSDVRGYVASPSN